MNIYKVTYVEKDASTTSDQTMSVDSIAALDYDVGANFVTFLGDDHKVVAAYAVHRVVSILTDTSGAQAS